MALAIQQEYEIVANSLFRVFKIAEENLQRITRILTCLRSTRRHSPSKSKLRTSIPFHLLVEASTGSLAVQRDGHTVVFNYSFQACRCSRRKFTMSHDYVD